MIRAHVQSVNRTPLGRPGLGEGAIRDSYPPGVFCVFRPTARRPLEAGDFNLLATNEMIRLNLDMEAAARAGYWFMRDNSQPPGRPDEGPGTGWLSTRQADIQLLPGR